MLYISDMEALCLFYFLFFLKKKPSFRLHEEENIILAENWIPSNCSKLSDNHAMSISIDICIRISIIIAVSIVVSISISLMKLIYQNKIKRSVFF